MHQQYDHQHTSPLYQALITLDLKPASLSYSFLSFLTYICKKSVLVLLSRFYLILN